jgi:hypothetical protein
MGTRDIYIALGVVFVFILIIDFLCNEKSTFCILPEQFIDSHIEKLTEMNKTFTQQDLQNLKMLTKKLENEMINEDDDDSNEKEENQPQQQIDSVGQTQMYQSYNGFQPTSAL